jgi:AraC-like DNA-binding protein
MLFPGVKHAYSPLPDTGWQEYWVGFSGIHADRLFKNGLFNPQKPVHHIGLNQEIMVDFEQIIRFCRQQPPGFQVRLGAIILQLLAHIYTSKLNLQTAQGDSELVQMARSVMQLYVDEGIEVNQIADKLGVGYKHLLEIFQQFTGLTPYQYFLQLRIHRAKELLENNSMSIKEVSGRMNFENQYYFSRIFKNKTGCSPSQWIALTCNNLKNGERFKRN